MTPQNGLLSFLCKETHSETKSWKSSRILRVNPIFHFSFFFIIFLHFSFFSKKKRFFSFFHYLSFIFHFFNFSIFHFFMFFIFSFFFSVFHFLSFSLSFFFLFHFLFFLSFMFFHVLSCSLLGAQNLIFWGLNFVTISLDSSYVKINFWAHLGR